MSALERARDVACLVDEHIDSFDLSGHARALERQRAAIVALLGVVEEQDTRLERLEDRLGRLEERLGGETIGMGG